MFIRRHFGAAAVAVLAIPRLAHAQTFSAWPSSDRSVEVIVPVTPGGPLDGMVRLVMPLVAERIPGLRAVVTNRPGAGSQIGLEATFNAAPDGYTFGATSMPAQMAIPVERPARYRAMEFTFLANVVEDPNAFYVAAGSPVRDVADLITRARAAPGTISCGTTGIGSDDHLFLIAFESTARVPPLVHVPFNGNAVLFPQLLGGHLDLAAVNISDAIALKREGKVRALAVAAAERSPTAPEVPTMRELGFEVIGAASRGILGPPSLPGPIAERLQEAFRGALADPRSVAEAERQFMPLRPLIGAEYRRMAQGIEDTVRALWQERPWRDR
ncbi:tripartite tricarboxylate transporter substrate binding protein [Siccirubricoccus sp. KC 17139]|uniref:Tripartite tricarboxylate transporter substrate binding protein n=1 Tax=Siccirubricoccus soli TaxID=2899147 RepID=A0ABT1D3M0_9PROT|nr:tripartite tricarboxylate transporter substrate binding protein [Siccirubricoccus soli]MCO6416518.1 tripartite tricarboxylate transporter substrate binding protein [Siccirubricoccus soli]MCP2682652.1 tripartite tricarboxylate transporter substrate binding protein [Siccirubricoccus soli]